MVTLTLGTKEFFPIKITDALDGITTLNGLGLAFDLFKNDEAENAIVTHVCCTNQGMIALPLIDNTTVGISEGYYIVFLKFTLSPKIPRLGPFKLRVDD